MAGTVARAKGIPLDANVVEQVLGLIDNASHDIKHSMQRDLEACRLPELESMIGVISFWGVSRIYTRMWQI